VCIVEDGVYESMEQGGPYKGVYQGAYQERSDSEHVSHCHECNVDEEILLT
jgi:hypothetical protein